MKYRAQRMCKFYIILHIVCAFTTVENLWNSFDRKYNANYIKFSLKLKLTMYTF